MSDEYSSFYPIRNYIKKADYENFTVRVEVCTDVFTNDLNQSDILLIKGALQEAIDYFNDISKNGVTIDERNSSVASYRLWKQ